MNKDWTKRSEWKTEPMRLIICGCGAVAGLLLALPLGAAQGGIRLYNCEICQAAKRLKVLSNTSQNQRIFLRQISMETSLQMLWTCTFLQSTDLAMSTLTNSVTQAGTGWWI